VSELFWVRDHRLAVVARPAGEHELTEDLRQLRSAGVDILVSALQPDEAAGLGLAEEARLAGDAGLEFVSIPIPDAGTPEPAAVRDRLDELARAVEGGKSVAIHCRAGVGRSPMLVATILALGGLDPEAAWQLVVAARGYPVPDNEGQRRWVAALLATRAESFRGQAAP
jgi:protein-tyrosine phosphatase